MTPRTVDRDGWTIDCPACGQPIKYTLLLNPRPPVPFFYSSTGNDVLLRRSDERKVDDLSARQSLESVPIEELEALWLSILDDAPDAPSGGRFALWANVKCTTCGKEVPYNKGVRDLSLRIFEPRIVVVDGAMVIGDSEAESWIARVRTDGPT